MATLEEYLKSQNPGAVLEPGEENNDTSTMLSILAGIGSGVFKIPEGIVSLGATLMDLGADTNKAAEVEKFFADINPFDELAQETTAGKLTELIVNLAVPGGIAFKAGQNLAKGALIAKKGGNYLNLTGQSGKNIAKGIQKRIGVDETGKLTKAQKLRGFDELATTADKVKAFGVGAGLGGVAEGIFVGDVEDAGTFGDLMGGPTKLDRELEGDPYDPAAELLNRIKFGTEGALFTGILGAAGQGIKKLKDTTKAGQAVDGKFNRWIDRWISQPLRARGKQTQEAAEMERRLKGATASDTNQVENIVRELDGSISKLFPFVRRAWMDEATFKDRKGILKKMNDLLLSSEQNAKNISGNNIDDVIKVGDDGIESIQFGPMNENLKKEFTAALKKVNKNISQKDITGILSNLSQMRSAWGRLFTSMGKRLDEDAVEQFQKLFGGKVTTWLDSSYDVIKARRTKLGERYPPTAQVMNTAKASFKELYQKSTGKELSDAAAQNEVLKIWQSADLEEGFKLNSKSDPYFKVPNFFLGKSAADEALKVGDNFKNLSELTGRSKEVIEELFGKSEDALQTMLNGTQKLSAIVRRNEYFDDLLNTSNAMRAMGKDAAGKFFRAPTFANSAEEAAEIFGGREGVDWKAVISNPEKNTIAVSKTKAGVQGVERLDARLDPAQTLKPLKGEVKPSIIIDDPVTGRVPLDLAIKNPLQTKFALTGTVDSIVKPVDTLAASKTLTSQLYQNLILYPKATSQMAKTILSPFTHARNFISAGAFAMANGIIPFADRKAVQEAWTALQVAGPGTRKSNQEYQKLVRLGVVNSQVQLGDLQNLLKDVNFGGISSKLGKARYSEEGLSSYGLNRLLKGLSRIKKFSEDAYTAEDDFWKIFTFLGEKNRLVKYMRNNGLREGMQFHDLEGAKKVKELIKLGVSRADAEKRIPKIRWKDDMFDLEAANIVKNNVPNYAFVSEFVKGLRKLPLGNFVSFPAEIMRTGTNVVQRALDEIFYQTTINNKLVRPLRNIGMQRLAGMAFTTAAVPTAAVAGMSALYNVTQDEREAMRRYVADWSKNSVLVPLRSKDGKLKYIDFSHANAYDTLTRPIQTILNRVNEGEQDQDGMMNDFIMGVIESTKELGSPFVTESIWTEALSDLVMRGGRTREGFKVWNDKDTAGLKIEKGVAHLIQSQAPLNWKQLNRIGLAMKPVDDLGRFDDRGREYELGNEALGIIGARVIDVDPEKAIKYKVANYLKGSRNAKSLFTSEVLKGGEVSPEQIIDSYIYANRQLYDVQKEMYRDLEAAKVLGMDSTSLGREVSRGTGKRNYGALNRGRFQSINISKNIFQGFKRIADELGIRNPLLDARGVINNIRGQLFNVGLGEGDEFPLIENPLSTPIIPDLIGQVNNMISPTANLAAAGGGGGGGPGFVGQGNINIDPASGLTLAEEIYFDPLEKLYRKQQRKPNQNQTKLT